jgi:2-methylaconitate cis-trans-isomerase PrpF
MGSPDVLEIDGLGGSRPITSKVAIVSRSQRDDADVDYTFAQVEIDKDQVIYSGNCGNISSGVGPFCVDEGLVNVQDGNTRVRIFNTNTKAVILADVPVKNGKAKTEGIFAVPGIPGTGAEIVMNWVGTIGAKTGHLLPTGKAVDKIKLEGGKSISASLVDAANPLVFVHAEDLGIEGSELNVSRTLRAIPATPRAREQVSILRVEGSIDKVEMDFPLDPIAELPHGDCFGFSILQNSRRRTVIRETLLKSAFLVVGLEPRHFEGMRDRELPVVEGPLHVFDQMGEPQASINVFLGPPDFLG